ncbi:MAG: NAD(P)/FAD-dependent oxidoreductase [Acidobacteria bacterium]|nr:NAD(P)/FAD-dependent oxidoreductase [Acidobacteriota bacterium]
MDRRATSVGDGEPLARRSEFDFVVAGAGPNGLGIAAYLAKWGFSVCVLEARQEIGGGAENAEPIPGCSIDPHATYLYGAAAPAFEQLQLGKHGFRMAYTKNLAGGITPDGRAFAHGFYNPESRLPETYESLMGRDITALYLEIQEGLRRRARDLLRAVYWTPPYDERWAMGPEDQPVLGVLKDALPVFDASWFGMSLVELTDALGIPDPLKAIALFGSWYNGPHPSWKGMAVPGVACNLLYTYSSGSPVGGMHSLAHALARCALAHGARIYVNAPVTEILVEGGRATGVRAADDAVLEEKTVRARLGVISALHVRQTLLDLVSPRHLAPDLVQNVRDISLKGGSLYVAHLVTSELPRYPDAGEAFEGDRYPSCTVLNASSDVLLEEMRDVYSFRVHPTDPDHYIVPICVHDTYDSTRAPAGLHVLSPIYLQCPPPEDHRDGPDAVNRAKDEILETILGLLERYAPNMTRDKVVASFVNTPRDSEFRNMAFVGGNWYGVRQSEEEWWSRRPLPELARYRTPIEGLYLCNHTSHPGGLCLIAVPYNLMHILIEDIDRVAATTPDWWYPSPWHISDAEGGTA